MPAATAGPGGRHGLALVQADSRLGRCGSHGGYRGSGPRRARRAAGRPSPVGVCCPVRMAARNVVVVHARRRCWPGRPVRRVAARRQIPALCHRCSAWWRATVTGLRTIDAALHHSVTYMVAHHARLPPGRRQPDRGSHRAILAMCSVHGNATPDRMHQHNKYHTQHTAGHQQKTP